MAHVICQPCVSVKDTACVDVCPNDAIHPRPDEPDFPEENQLFINPLTCSDCGLCVEVCPRSAIYPQQNVPSVWQQYIQLNADYYE